MTPQVVERGVVEGANGRVLDRADHSFGLAGGPRMIRLGEPVLDAAIGADPPEDMRAAAGLRPLIVLDDLRACVGQQRVELVGTAIEEGLETAGSDELRQNGRV